MKKFILLMIAATILLSCNQLKSDKEAEPTGNKSGQKGDSINGIVKLSLEPAEFKLFQLPDTIKVTMINHTKDTITTGEHYSIEKLGNNEWIGISAEDMAFHDIGYVLRPNDTKIFTKYLFKNIINYKTGKYRVVKYYLKHDHQKAKKNFNVYAEFDIK